MSIHDQAGGTTLQPFFQTANAYQRTQALKAAAIAEGRNCCTMTLAQGLPGTFVLSWSCLQL